MENLEYSGQKKLRKSILACIKKRYFFLDEMTSGGEEKRGVFNFFVMLSGILKTSF
jgi:hypothetical protein